MSDEAFDPVMLEMLQTEIAAQLPPLGAALVSVRTNPAAPQVADLVRCVHSIRGAARIVNAEALAEAAGDFEKKFDALIAAKQPAPATLLDALQTLLDDLQQFIAVPPDEASHWMSSHQDAFKECASRARRAGATTISSQMQPTLMPSSGSGKLLTETPAPAPVPAAAAPAFEPIDASMFEMFQTEVSQHAADLSSGLLDLENSASQSEHVANLMRAAHSMKGAARIVGIEPAVELTHAMEDYFVAVQNRKQRASDSAIDVMLRAVDLLSKLAAQDAAACTAWLGENASAFGSLALEIAALNSAPVAAPQQKKETAPPAAPETEEVLDASMLDMFRMEVEGYATQLSEGLLAVENGSASSETLQVLMRAAHSIKGASRIVGIEPGVELAHAMEDCLVAAQKGELPLEHVPADSLLRAVDFFSQFSATADDAAKASQWLKANRTEMGTLSRALTEATKNGGTAPTLDTSTPASSSTGIVSQNTGPQSLQSQKGSQTQVTQSGAANAARAVRVTAESLNRILGLAGESLVETRWHARFQASLMQIKQEQARLQNRIRQLRQKTEELGVNEVLGAGLADIEQAAAESARHFAERFTEFDRFAYRADTLSQRLYKEAVSSRMRPFDDGVQGFPRLVRDVARKMGKKVNFVIEGRTTEVDRDILEKLEAPLNHLIRNAVDHGCETPAERKNGGKSEAATLKVEARHRAGMLQVSVSDDGRGVDLDRLKARILEKQLAAPEMVGRMSTAELLEFLFLPGFSTKSEVTEISGRGVGLDVVQSMVQEAGGTVRIQSRFGEGTSFLLQLPITRSVLRTLLVKINGDPYAFPLSRVDRLQSVEKDAVRTLEGRQFVKDDEGALGVVRASQVLGLSAKHASSGSHLHIVVCSDRNTRYGWVVDSFDGECELVLRTLDPRLGKVPTVSAASVLDDGTPIVILDVEDMVRATENVLKSDSLDVVGAELSGARTAQKRRILVVDDSFTVRETERKLLERAGFDVKTAVDGMEGWNAVRTSSFDLVVSDVDMPRMNGFEFVKRIKQDSRLQNLPVIIVSYKDRDEDRARGMEVGANLYLTKGSFQDQTFITAVQELLGAKV